MAFFDTIGGEIISYYNSFLSMFPLQTQQIIGLLLLTTLIVVYSVFIWKFYRFIAKKNILGLNLSQYNNSSHPFFEKALALIFYILEYIIILPIIIFFWFAVFTLFLIFLTEDVTTKQLLIVSVTIIAAIRVTSYYSEDLSKDLAKLLPFTLLAVAILKPGFFDIERIISQMTELPGFIEHIVVYLIFIIILESILRFFDFLFSLFGIEEIEAPEKKE